MAATPTPLGAALMAVAGVAWALYSLRGRKVFDPLAATAGNFARAAVLALPFSVVLAHQGHANALGIAMAVASGAVTSGMGFVIWYTVLARISAFQAATVQLSVPLIATAGGALFLSEPITWQVAAGSVAILGGIALVLAYRAPKRHG
jgi:drug/metabolite transporter (DMT)-like permease